MLKQDGVAQDHGWDNRLDQHPEWEVPWYNNYAKYLELDTELKDRGCDDGALTYQEWVQEADDRSNHSDWGS